ncbi:MAG: TetR family transcriptional regulator [Marmoricola sp.]
MARRAGSPEVRGRGRRPGAPDTRAEVLAAARRLFGERGFSGTTIRAIATEANVDPALVHHYFGAKDDLFVASLQVGVDPRAVLRPVIEGGVDGAGERLLRAFLSVWDDPELRPPLLALARSLMEASAQHMFRDGFFRVVLLPVAQALGVDRPEERMALVASQLVGLVMTRYVLELQPLASLPSEVVVASVAPTVQRYLQDPLPEGRAGSA